MTNDKSTLEGIVMMVTCITDNVTCWFSNFSAHFWQRKITIIIQIENKKSTDDADGKQRRNTIKEHCYPFKMKIEVKSTISFEAIKFSWGGCHCHCDSWFARGDIQELTGRRWHWWLHPRVEWSVPCWWCLCSLLACLVALVSEHFLWKRNPSSQSALPSCRIVFITWLFHVTFVLMKTQSVMTILFIAIAKQALPHFGDGFHLSSPCSLTHGLICLIQFLLGCFLRQFSTICQRDNFCCLPHERLCHLWTARWGLLFLHLDHLQLSCL